MKNVIAVVTAINSEEGHLVKLLNKPRELTDGAFRYIRGELGTHEVNVIKSGMGKVNAALHTQYIIDKVQPELVINTGVAGGIADGLSVSDIIVASGLCQHDFDLSPIGFHKGNLVEPDTDEPTVYKTDERLSERLLEVSSAIAGKEHARRGIIATGDQFIASHEQKMRIKAEFNATAAEMEGGAIAQTACANAVPFVALRVISDLADGSADKSYEKFEDSAAQKSARAVAAFIETL